MREQEAFDNFQNKKFNCCESLLLTYGAEAGLPEDILPKLGTGFGGGYAHQGLTCGVLNAATILLNIKYGRDQIDDGKLEKNYKKVKEFHERFKDEFGSLYCKGITKTNFAYDEKFKEWLAAGGRDECAELVKKSALIYETITNS